MNNSVGVIKPEVAGHCRKGGSMSIMFIVGLGVFLYGIFFGGRRSNSKKVHLPLFGYVDTFDPKLFSISNNNVRRVSINKKNISVDKNTVETIYELLLGIVRDEFSLGDEMNEAHTDENSLGVHVKNDVTDRENSRRGGQ